MSEQRDMSGVLFKNAKKEQDKHPDYEGRCTIDGKDFWMKAWIKDGAKGKFMSFAFKPPERGPQWKAAAQARRIRSPRRNSVLTGSASSTSSVQHSDGAKRL